MKCKSHRSHRDFLTCDSSMRAFLRVLTCATFLISQRIKAFIHTYGEMHVFSWQLTSSIRSEAVSIASTTVSTMFLGFDTISVSSCLESSVLFTCFMKSCTAPMEDPSVNNERATERCFAAPVHRSRLLPFCSSSFNFHAWSLIAYCTTFSTLLRHE